MHTVDVVVVCAAVVLIVVFAGVLARQRYMLRVRGAVPLAIQLHGTRWSYGIARFVGGELRWYRAIGLGARPTKVMNRAALTIHSRRSPEAAELTSLPATAVIVQCRDRERTWVMAFSESAFTGFVSWLEATAPRAGGARG